MAETFRSVESKIQRGSFRLEFFVATLKVIDSEYPPQWAAYLESDLSIAEAATQIFHNELLANKLSIEVLCSLLGQRGISIDASTVATLLADHDVPFTLFLQLGLTAPIHGLSRFVDQCDIEAAAIPATI
ncbi:hypothetical protein CYJ10_30035 [Cupriavidus pauculus]|uniref:Uncharacterized protein n=2 Tax=Cupriavidus pauculus TaxID=82633 RepID=A0A2N5C3P2_9BURK|nr:hypothetical protein CYJ10_30035 [Cupriavidus pauculus]